MKCFGKDNPIRRNNNTLQINLFLFTTETQGMQVRHKLTTDVLILKSCHRSECGSPVSEAVLLGAEPLVPRCRRNPPFRRCFGQG